MIELRWKQIGDGPEASEHLDSPWLKEEGHFVLQYRTIETDGKQGHWYTGWQDVPTVREDDPAV